MKFTEHQMDRIAKQLLANYESQQVRVDSASAEHAPVAHYPDATGMWRNPLGHFVPDAMVSDIDKLREQTVVDLCERALYLTAMLKSFKQRAFEDIATFIEISAERFNVSVGGKKGNVRLSSFSGEWRVERCVQEYITFDERLLAAKALIDECITEWSAGSRVEMQALVNNAFSVDGAGRISTNRVLSLRRIEIKDDKWQRAMRAIHESIQVTGSRSYVRIYRRVGDSDKYQAIPLDLASV